VTTIALPAPAAVAASAGASGTAAPPAAQPAPLSTGAKMLALGVMCVGFFIAYLDIQIVAASLKEIGGGLSASQDEIAWCRRLI
jgi:DHA2 family multidrug resistance protein